MGEKWELNEQSASALEQLASQMVLIVANIDSSMNQLEQTYNSESSELGVHGDSFEEMIKQARNEIKSVQEAMSPIEEALKKTSEQIREYVASKV